MAEFSSHAVKHFAEALQTRYAALQLGCVSLSFGFPNLGLYRVHLVTRVRRVPLDVRRFRAHRAAAAPTDGRDVFDEYRFERPHRLAILHEPGPESLIFGSVLLGEDGRLGQ